MAGECLRRNWDRELEDDDVRGEKKWERRNGDGLVDKGVPLTAGRHLSLDFASPPSIALSLSLSLESYGMDHFSSGLPFFVMERLKSLVAFAEIATLPQV